MFRIILDTNIYGKIIEEVIENEIVEKIHIHKNDVIIYGMKIIRNEIRAAPKHSKDSYNLRLSLLKLYDNLTKGKQLDIKPIAKTLVSLYYKKYRENGGNVSFSDIKNDMMIVAEATVSRLDIVVSEDNRTMLSKEAKEAYLSVNKANNFITPGFISYKEFKEKLL